MYWIEGNQSISHMVTDNRVVPHFNIAVALPCDAKTTFDLNATTIAFDMGSLPNYHTNNAIVGYTVGIVVPLYQRPDKTLADLAEIGFELPSQGFTVHEAVDYPWDVADLRAMPIWSCAC